MVNFEAVEQKHLLTYQENLNSVPRTIKEPDDEPPSQKVAEPADQTQAGSDTEGVSAIKREPLPVIVQKEPRSANASDVEERAGIEGCDDQ
jgi:hypothetical protein